MKIPKILKKKKSGSVESSPASSPGRTSISSTSSSRRSLPKSPLMSPKSGSSDIRSELEAVFKLYDANGDGKISSSELELVLKALGDAPTKEELLKILEEVDTDGDGFISLEEFIRFNTETSCESELQAAFYLFDIDRNGFISADELHRVLIGLGYTSLTMEDCGKMIRGVDVNGDGHVDFEEFKVMLAGV